MKVLVFGSGGQVARALASTAPAHAEPTFLGRDACDLSAPGAARRPIEKLRPDLVLNAAAYTAVDEAEREPELARRLNALAPAEMAAAARSVGARFVHLSTDFVFDGSQGAPYGPDDETHPISVYGVTKRDGEEAVRAAAADSLIVRTAWVYSAQGRNFVTTMLRLMRERDEVRVVADQIGTPTHATSLASALWSLAATPARGLHHFTDAGVASWYDFAVAIQEEALATGLLDRQASLVPIATNDYPTPARRPACGVLDKDATWQVLGAAPPHWRVNLRACLGEFNR